MGQAKIGLCAGTHDGSTQQAVSYQRAYPAITVTTSDNTVKTVKWMHCP